MPSELISTVILITLSMVVGVFSFVLINSYVSEYLYQNRVSVLVKSMPFDLEARVEYYNYTHIFIRIVRIGSVQLGGILPLVSLEATNDTIYDPSSIWVVESLYVLMDPSYMMYSPPIDPTKGYPPPGAISFTRCSGRIYGSQMIYIYRDSLYPLSDIRRDIHSIAMCTLPQPTAPLGHLLVAIRIPDEAQNHRFFVVSLWILVDGKPHNIANIAVQRLH